MFKSQKFHDKLMYVAAFFIILSFCFIFNYSGITTQTPLPFIMLFWILGILSVVYLYRNLTHKLPVSRDLMAVTLKNFTARGFDIQDFINGDVYVKWSDVKNVYYTSNHSDIIIEFKKGHVYQVYRMATGWFELGLNVPLHFSHFDQKFAKNALMAAKDCPVCGHYSVIGDHCANCHYSEWNPDFMKEKYDTRNKYIHQMQLEHFATIDKEEPIEFYPKTHKCFKFNRNWKPITTEGEVLKYSMLNVWNSE